MSTFKRILRYFAYLLGILLLLVIGVLAWHYKSDIPVEVLKEKYAFEDSKYLDIDGMQVHYRQVGEGQPFVMIHGFGANLWNWEDWTTIFSKDHQVITLDLPGFGLTGPRPDGDYTTDKYVNFLNRFFDKIGVDTFYLAGNSMGGGIAWNYTLAHPEQVKKLILVNSSGYPRDSTDRKLISGFQVLNMPIINQLVTKITPTPLLKKTVEDVYGDKSLVKEGEVEHYESMLRRTGNRQALLDKRSSPRKQNHEDIKNIKTPTLIIWGDQDVLISYHHASQFERDIEGSKAIVYKGVGHIPMVEIAERSAKDVYIFLEGQ